MTITVISHIFNEEYLLPFWLEYHSLICDNGIIIDYCCTDNSINIIKKFCPHWKIIKTRNINLDGSPNFDAALVDLEVMDIEKTVSGFKIVLNVTEWLLFSDSSQNIMNSLNPTICYHIEPYSCINPTQDIYPLSCIDFLKKITKIIKLTDRGFRMFHNKPALDYSHGRHYRMSALPSSTRNVDADITQNQIATNMCILWTGYYPFNQSVIHRKLQIQKNIPKTDVIMGRGHQHITNYTKCMSEFNIKINNSIVLYNFPQIYNMLCNTINIIQNSNTHIYYSELYVNSNWGNTQIILNNDENLIDKTNFNDIGYKVYNITNFNGILTEFLLFKIKSITTKTINLELYHTEITDEEHAIILKSMPYKKEELLEFSNYIISFLSTELMYELKIFNDDIWYRICRPSSKYANDNNPCHRDIYLDFYKNTINIYLPIVGSNELSSLSLQPGSHFWNESETSITTGGLKLNNINKKYSVDMIVASKILLQMIQPNPTTNQIMVFSPYLIHGCAINNNLNLSRISVEMRFIKNNSSANHQEQQISNFLKIRKNIEPSLPHYRAIILILASNESHITKSARKVWKKYMNLEPSFKVFFVYGKLDNELEDTNSNDLICNDVLESLFPAIFKKTFLAMKYINKNFSFDYLVRTNISTFWDFTKLKKHLDELPDKNCYSGDGPFFIGHPHNCLYVSGTDTIVTKEMIQSIISNESKIDFTLVEDSVMGQYFNGILKIPILPNRICFFEDITIDTNQAIIKDRINQAIENNKDHYRVKTLGGNRCKIDLLIYTYLLKHIYNINI